MDYFNAVEYINAQTLFITLTFGVIETVLMFPRIRHTSLANYEKHQIFVAFSATR